MEKIAIITARSGSKGLRNKNIINLCGKPLMAYSIEAAVETKLFERVIVSTDSHKYGEIAEEYGAEVDYRREELASDYATTYMVLEDWLNRLDRLYDYFVLLQPTSPFRTSRHLREAMQDFEDNFDSFDFMVSVKEADHDSSLIHKIDEDGSLKFFDSDYSTYRRQTQKEYTPNGAIYIGKPEAYLKQKHFYGARAMAYFMGERESIDIDNELDYRFAEYLLKCGWL